MFKITLKTIGLLYLCLFSLYGFSGHDAGAMITYKPTGVSNQYEITLELYSVCNTPPPTIANLDYWDDCGTPALPLSLNYVSSVDVSQYCSDSAALSECAGGSHPGYERHTFMGIVTFGGTCNAWHLSFTAPQARYGENIVSAGVYVESTINTNNGIENTSPIILAPHIPYVCLNTPVSWDFGAIEPDCDSLVYSLVNPQSADGVNVSFVPGFSASSPMPGMSIDQSTGVLSFTPVSEGNYVLAIKIEEYNTNGVLVGSVIQDFQIFVYNCSNNAPTFANSLTNFNSNGTGATYDAASSMIAMCDGDEFCFDLVLNDLNLSDSLTISSNVNAVLPNATVTFSGTLPLVATVCWVYNPNYSANYLWFKGADDACLISGHDFFQLKLKFPIPLSVTYLDSICGDMDADFMAIGDAPITWSVLSGDPMVLGTNFSCNDCPSPVATPAVTTTYLIETGSACNEVDTATVTVVSGNLGNISTEIFNLDTTICAGSCIDIEANAEMNFQGVIENQFDALTDVPLLPNATVSSNMFIPAIAAGFDTLTVGSIKSVCIDIEHSNVEDLDIYLVAPDGTQFELSTGNGGTGDNYSNTCFTFDAFFSVVAGNAPFSANYIPEEGALDSAFSDGTHALQGFWAIEIVNNGTIAGIIDEWHISFCDPFDLAVEPATISWSNLDGVDTLVVEPTICPTVGGEYVLTSFNNFNCWASDTINITISNNSTAGLDTTVELSVYAGQVSLISYLAGMPLPGGDWFDGTTGNAILGQINPDTLVDLSTFIYVTTNTNGCTDTAELTLDIIDYCLSVNPQNPNVLPLPDAGEDSTVQLNLSAAAPIDLNDLLGGNPDPNGGWEAPIGTGFNPLTHTDSLDATGQYFYIVENDNGCIDTAVLTINVVDDLGLEGPIALAFNIYPNPSSGLLNIESNAVDPLTIEWYNALGEKVAPIVKVNGSQMTVDLSGLAEGIYLMQLIQDDQVVHTERVVVAF